MGAIGAGSPRAEEQSKRIGDHLTGRCALPPRSKLLAAIARERAAIRGRHVASKRHTMRVDYDDHLFGLPRERRRGAERARAARG